MATKALQAKTSDSTSVALKKNNSIVSIKEQLAAQAASVADRIAPPSGSGIKLNPGSMTLPDGTKTPGPLDMVIVDFVAMNQFFPDDFDRNNIKPPVCFAIGSNPLKLVPSPNSPEPQAKTCAECPMNAFGSKGKGKACNNERKLVLLEPDGDAETPLLTLKVAKMGVKGFDSYVAGVARTFNSGPVGVITTVGLNDSVDYANLTFGNPQPNPNVGEHLTRMEEARAVLATEPDVSGYVAAAATKKPAARPAARR